MIPLMLEDGYAPKGWLGIMLGTRLWYGFYGHVLAEESAFESKINDLCRELGPPHRRKATRSAPQSRAGTATPTPPCPNPHSRHPDLSMSGTDRTSAGCSIGNDTIALMPMAGQHPDVFPPAGSHQMSRVGTQSPTVSEPRAHANGSNLR